MLKNKKAIIFDLDDTLSNRKRAFGNYGKWFIKKYFEGRPLPDPLDSMLQLMAELNENGYCNRITFYSSLIDRWNMEGLTAHMLEEEYIATFHTFTVPDDDMWEVLDGLKQRFKLGIITNGRTDIQNAKIDRIGIRHYFGTILVSMEIGMHKPDPKIFFRACHELGVAPEEAVFVGDHYENDVLGAIRAGMQAVWYIGEEDMEVLPQMSGVLVIRKLAELFRLFL